MTDKKAALPEVGDDGVFTRVGTRPARFRPAEEPPAPAGVTLDGALVHGGAAVARC